MSFTQKETRLLCLLIAITCTTTVTAQDDTETTTTDLDPIIVSATPLNTTVEEMAQSTTVLEGAELDRRTSATIGETVNEIPGVHSSQFGAGVGRPIIRGLDGPRIEILENSMGTGDVSNVSVDHAVSIEPFLADQIEVIRGPATLLYGSRTIGGIVNVETNRIPKSIDGAAARVQVEGNTVANGYAGAASLDGGNGQFAIHVDASIRDDDDYDIPGFANLEEPGHDEPGHDDEEEENPYGRLPNSFNETKSGALGMSISGENDSWRLGASFSGYDNNYGIPGGGHHHEEEEGEPGDGEEEEEENVTIDLNQKRFDVGWVWNQPGSWVDRIKADFASVDYEHTEFEGVEVGTQFDTDSVEGRFELTHAPINNWFGAMGLQYKQRDFIAIGDEAFVPPADTDSFGLFLVEQYEGDGWRFEVGGRYEEQDVQSTTAGINVDHSLFSLSAGYIYHIQDHLHLSMAASRAQRAPTEEELLSDGPHIATQTFEIGDPSLQEETSNSFEIGLRQHHGRLSGSITGFYNDFDDYIYLADTGLEEDELPVRVWTQQGATFWGFEAEGSYIVADTAHGQWRLNGLLDMVRAELSDGSNVPRIPPLRYGLGLEWEQSQWFAGLKVIRYDEQDRIADFEEATSGYTMVDADVSYLMPTGQSTMEFYLKARNLGDEEARNHTSFLKETAPLPGRNFILGVRWRF